MNPETKITEVVRLRPDLYAALEKKLSRLIVTENTTAFTAGFALGVESVLKELRNGYTINQTS